MSVFDNDPALPSLPIPELDETINLLKQSMKPLLQPSQWEKSCAALDRLSSQGKPLADLLVAHRESQPGNASWLRPIWDDIYMTYRGTLPLNMNYCFEFTPEKWGNSALSNFTAAMCLVAGQLRRETLPPESTKAGFLSMDALRSMIYTRIPCPVRDVWYNPPLAAPATIAVACKGHWFIVSAVNGQGELLQPSAIQEAFEAIKKRADGMGQAVPVGSFTAAGRDQAAQTRDAVLANPMNRLNLESIEKSLFAVCLDQAPPAGRDFCLDLIGGDSANRWFDKSLQVISEPGGRLGVNIEHSGCDAGIWIYAFDRVDEAIRAKNLPGGQGKAHIQALQWNIGPDTAARLDSMREGFAGAMKALTMRHKRMTSVSKDLIKAQNCSPDAFAQLLFQAAYYKETKNFRSAYAAASTRAFYQGRTESIRPVTEESAAFVKALYEGADGQQQLFDKFRLAEKAHAGRISRAQKALGPERHMSGLSYMYQMHAGTPAGKGLAKPEIFEDQGWKTLRHDVLSTSGVSSEYIDYFGFPPVVADGLGIGYGLKAGALHMAVSSYGKSDMTADAFLSNMEEAAGRFMKILTAGNAKAR